ncbi:MAG: hypothetical protein ACRDJ5_03200 [Actinomycetota bacterium]
MKSFSIIGKRWLVVSLAIALVTQLFAGAALARTSASGAAPRAARGLPAQPANKGPAQARPDHRAPDCNLKASSHESRSDEFLSCIGVSATLSRAPAVGETATLHVEVQADRAYDAADISVQLPPTLEFVDAPAAARLGAGRSAYGRGPKLVDERALAPAAARNLNARVRAVDVGAGEIVVAAKAPTGYGADAGADYVFLTVKRDAAGSKVDVDTAQVRTPQDLPEGLDASRATERRPSEVPEPSRQSSPQEAPSSPSAPTGCVSGTWLYQDNNGTWRPARNWLIQVWDDDTFGDSLLASGLAAQNGTYNFCVDMGTEGFPDSGTADIYVKFISENGAWKVQNASSNPYVYQTATVNDVGSAGLNLGSLGPQPVDMRGAHAFDEVNDVWDWKGGGGWDDVGSWRRVIVNWTPTSTDGTYYSLGANDVHLAAADPDSQIVVAHEVGHALMDDAYEDAFPSAPNCSPHSIQGASSEGCAWTEGFAEWLPSSVYNDPFFRWPSGASLNLESPTWNTSGWDSGNTVEGRVAGALIDISDFANEASYDRHGEGDPGPIWTTFQNNVSNTFNQFWTHRGAGGFNVSPFGALASVYQNTIDINFRDPLGNYSELVRPAPNPHNYSYNTTSGFWSVVALRPDSADYDLDLYDDFGQTSLLGSSVFGGNTIDFMAVDSNHRALGDYFPRARVFSGSGNYRIELAQGSNIIGPGTQSMFMDSNDVVMVRDLFLNAGQEVAIKAQPSNGGQDPELLLMGSDGANSATWVRSRGQAVAGASIAGPGGAEQFTFTAPAADWYGLVLLNKAGSGNYNVIVDTDGPTGNVTINGGAAATNNPAVTLGLSATDPQSGVTHMRISTDGVMDSEPFVAMAPSANVTLPAGEGTKVVRAQFRNSLGMTSSIVGDTIVLDSTAPATPNMTAPGALFQRNTSFPISWGGGSDALSGLANYDVRYRSAAATSAVFGPFVVHHSGTTATSSTFTGTPGRTYCFSVRARDNAGNVSPYGPQKCTTIPLDDAALARTGTWTSGTGAGYFLNTFSRSQVNGSKLSMTGLQAKRLALLVSKAPGAGTIRVFFNGAPLGTVNLDCAPAGCATEQKKQLVTFAPFGSIQAGTVRIDVVSSGKPVKIDGVGVSKM